MCMAAAVPPCPVLYTRSQSVCRFLHILYTLNRPQLSLQGPQTVHDTHQIGAIPCVPFATIKGLVLWNFHLQAVG